MPGIVVFTTLSEALRSGFHVIGSPTLKGYDVARRRPDGVWERAIVDLTQSAFLKESNR